MTPLNAQSLCQNGFRLTNLSPLIRFEKMAMSDGVLIHDGQKFEASDRLSQEAKILKEAGEVDAARQRLTENTNLVQEFPKINVAKNGPYWVDAYRIPGTEIVQFVILNSRTKGIHKNIKVEIPNWVIAISRLSSDGNFLILIAESGSKMALLDIQKGEITYESQVRKGEEFNGVNGFFSDNTSYFIVERSGFIDIINLKGESPTLEKSLYLGGKEIDLAEGLLVFPISSGDIGELHYIESSNSLIAFRYRDAPIVIEFDPDGVYHVKELQETSMDSYRFSLSESSSRTQENYGAEIQNRDLVNQELAALIQAEHYYANGAVSPIHQEIYAIKTRNPPDGTYQLSLEVFDINTGSLKRTLPIDATVSTLAISPDHRHLAIASNSSHVVQIFQLRRDASSPIIRIQTELYETALLSFSSNSSIFVGSRNFNLLYEFDLSVLENQSN